MTDSRVGGGVDSRVGGVVDSRVGGVGTNHWLHGVQNYAKTEKSKIWPSG